MQVYRRGDSGPAVAEVQAALVALGRLPAVPEQAVFDDATDAALRGFQLDRGLVADGVVGPETYSALQAARLRLGDRLLTWQTRMLVGDDVTALQERLAELGFDAGRPDGLFGPRTEAALKAFQREYGLRPDGVCGPATLRALRQLGRLVVGGRPQVLREAERIHASGSALAGKIVVIDPGHNGGNIDHLGQVTRLVDAGNGERKPCNEIGAQTATGYAEHAFTWDVALRLRSLLAARGLDVRLTRSSDRGVGPCVDVRGRFGNVVKADAVVSVHADGGPTSGTGFHVIEAARPAGDKAASTALALAVRKAMLAGSGLRYATYIAGGDGLDVRDDLAGLTLSGRPTVMVEAGNMANRADAALQASAAGRQRVAAALATGILAFLAIR